MSEQNQSSQLLLKFNRQFLRDFWVLFKPFWISKEKNIALSMLALNVIGILVGVWGSVGLNNFNKDFFNALSTFDHAAILTAMGHFLFFLIILVLAIGYSSYLNSLISIRWQRWLTKNYLQKWLSNCNYYQLQVSNKNVDNPDQRISEDLQQFAATTLSIFFDIFQSALTLGTFGYILWNLSGNITIPIGSIHLVIPGYLCWVALLFAAFGTFVMGKIGKNLSTLDYQQQKYNADFRYSLIRFRESSEQIAMSRGEKVEQANFDTLFSRIYANFFTIASLHRNLMFFRNSYSNVSSIIAILFSIPLYLAKKIQLGGIMQISGAFGTVLGAFSVFIDSFYQLTEWRAVVHRLTEFNAMIDSLSQSQQNETQKSIVIEKKNTSDIIIQQLHLTSPQGVTLIKNLDLILDSGKFTLLCGASGLGKSTLLRAIAGVWVYGSGKIQLPQNANIVFLPQKPYLPLGSLKDALLYPNHDSIDDELLFDVLEICFLGHFKSKLNEVKNWSHTLSLGEQQLLSFGRLFLYKPDIICLDEATSALDEQKESLMYGNIKKYLPNATIISVGHRSSLQKFHDRMLTLSGEDRKQMDSSIQQTIEDEVPA